MFLNTKTIKQKYDLIILLQLINSYLKNASKSSYLLISLEKKEEIILKIIINCYSKAKNIANLVAEIEILQRFIAYILRKKRYKKVKSSWKPKLLSVMKTVY